MKTIVFKIGKFPLVSETFVINQILIAMALKFHVKVLVNNLADFEMSRQGAILRKYKIDQKIILQDYQIPKSKFNRLFKAIFLCLFHVNELPYIINYYRTKKKFSLTYLFEFKFFRQLRKVDIIHVQYGTNSKPIDDLKKSGFFNMPLVVTFHGHDAFFPINNLIPKEGYYDKLFEVGDLFTANTPYLKEQLIIIGCPENNTVTVPMCIDTEFFYARKTRPLSKTKINLLSVGRLEEIKGHQWGIKIVAILISKGYNVEYTIIGEGSSRRNLELLISKLNLEHKVKLLGAKSQREIREYYWASDIFMMTSTGVEGNIRETQGIVTLEAQACGLPVVAFESGGVKYTITDGITGFLVKEKDIQSFSNRIMDLINDPVLYKKVAKNTRGFILDHFSLIRITSKWKTIYTHLTNS